MIQAYLLLFAGLLLLFVSGKYLVESSVVIAARFRVPTMVVGLTVVAFGTSAPELLVSLQAAFRGFPEIAMGNVVGSNISNILLVLAITAVIFPIPVPRKSVVQDWPVLMGVSLLLFAFSWNGELSRIEGGISIMLLAAYLIFLVRSVRKDPQAGEPESGAGTEGTAAGAGQGEAVPSGRKTRAAVLIFLISCAGLALGAYLLVDNAADIAEKMGISQRVISITTVAVGTSIPELATSVIAALKKQTDISVGNIIGSNIMNIMSVLGLTGIVGNISVSREIARFDIPWMLGVTFVLLLLMVPAARSRITRWEGSLMIVIYLLYIYLIF
jgi:cation:H+ antiporter